MRVTWRVLGGMVLALLAAVPGAEAASPGAPDSSFAGTGSVITAVRLLGTTARPDGGVIAVGTLNSQAQVLQFGAGGALVRTVAAAGPAARAVALQGDGKFVVVGGDSTTTSGLVVQRFNADGSVDTGFGSGGLVTLYSGSSAQANAVAIQPDGRIVVAGSGPLAGSRGGYPGVALARLNPNGSLDPSFGSGGSEVVDLGLSGRGFSSATGVVVQGNGQIVISGFLRPDQTESMLVARFNSNGSLDASYDDASQSFCPWFCHQFSDQGYTSGNAIALDSSGRAVVAVTALSFTGGSDAIVVRLTTAGRLDGSFGSGGEAVIPATANRNQFDTLDTYPGALTIATFGNEVVAGGIYDNNSFTDSALWALTPSGALDTRFGGSGGVIGPAGQGTALTPAPGGTLVLVGQRTGAYGPSGFVARYGAPPVTVAPPTPRPPTVLTGSASSVTSVSASLSGQVNPQGSVTAYHFDYGTSGGYGSTTGGGSLAAGSDTRPVTAQLTGLRPGTTYHYRLVASSPGGTVRGQDGAFTTLSRGGAAAPAVSGEAVRHVTETTATLSAVVNPEGARTSYHFDYGRSVSYGSRTAAATLSAASQASTVRVGLHNLRPGTTYHYRLVAGNAGGTTYGPDRTFRTAARLTGSVRGAPHSISRAKLASGGLKLSGGCSAACVVHASLIIPLSLVRHLRLGHHTIVLGTASGRLRRVGRLTLRLRLGQSGRKALTAHRVTPLTLSLTFTPSLTGPSVVIAQTVALQ